MVDDTQGLATRAAEMALQILAGTRPQDIPFEQPARVPAFDWRQLHRWGISESRLPAGQQDPLQAASAPGKLYRVADPWLRRAHDAAERADRVAAGAARAPASDGGATSCASCAPCRTSCSCRRPTAVYVDYHASDPGQLLSRLLSSSWGKTCATYCQPCRSARSKPHSPRRPAPWDRSSPSSSRYDLELPAGNRRFEARLVRSSDNQIAHAGARHHRAGASRDRSSRGRATLRLGVSGRSGRVVGLELRDQPALHRRGAEIALGVRRRGDRHQPGGLGRTRASAGRADRRRPGEGVRRWRQRRV